MNKVIKVSLKVYIEHCMKVKYVKVYVKQCLKVKCVDVYVKHCLKVTCVDAYLYVKQFESKVRQWKFMWKTV